MIKCPNCKFANGDLAITCGNCGAFVQNRVQNLDLFSTIWQLIESPQRGMRRVVLSVHKNYVIFLSSLYGIGLAFFLMWLLRLGGRFDNLQKLLFAGIIAGIPLGIIHFLFIGIIGIIVGRIAAARFRLSDLLGVAAYASVPVILGAVFILPVEIMTFGQYLFTYNPSPFVIKPVPYVVLVSLDTATILWSGFLFVSGIRILGGMGALKATLIAAVVLILSLAILVFMLRGVLLK
jgi:hypothetical protein